MNEMSEILWSMPSHSLAITKTDEALYRLTSGCLIVADFTSFELACLYAHDEFIL